MPPSKAFFRLELVVAVDFTSIDLFRMQKNPLGVSPPSDMKPVFVYIFIVRRG